jgi:hypothetical protein
MIILSPRLTSCKKKSNAQCIFRIGLAYYIVYTTTLGRSNFVKSVSFDDTYQFRLNRCQNPKTKEVHKNR